jgi:hypothetical protein
MPARHQAGELEFHKTVFQKRPQTNIAGRSVAASGCNITAMC